MQSHVAILSCSTSLSSQRDTAFSGQTHCQLGGDSCLLCWQPRFERSHFTAERFTKVCFPTHLWQKNRQCSNRILSYIWWAMLLRTELICIKLRSSLDHANSHTVTGLSTRCAVSIMHCTTRSPALHSKWKGSIDIRRRISCACIETLCFDASTVASSQLLV